MSKGRRIKISSEKQARENDEIIIDRIKYLLYKHDDKTNKIKIRNLNQEDKDAVHVNISILINEKFQLNTDGNYVKSRWKTLKDTLGRYYNKKKEDVNYKPTGVQNFAIEKLKFLEEVRTEDQLTASQPCMVAQQNLPSCSVQENGSFLVQFHEENENTISEFPDNIIAIEAEGDNDQSQVPGPSAINSSLQNTLQNDGPMKSFAENNTLHLPQKQCSNGTSKGMDKKKLTPISALFTTKVPEISKNCSDNSFKKRKLSDEQIAEKNKKSLVDLEICPQAICIFKEFELLPYNVKIDCFLQLKEAALNINGQEK